MKENLFYKTTSIKKYTIIKTIVFMMVVLISILSTGCKKKSEPSPIKEIGRYIDTVNNDTYLTVKIGNQWWMVQNLKAKKYRNGTPINKIQNDTSKWSSDTTGAYCVYEENNNAPGLLYNWYAVTNINELAPAGWHIPSDAEWKMLEEYLGMSAIDANSINWRGTHEADKLKIKSRENWITYGSIWSTNESGFTALGGGCRLFNGIFASPGLSATAFWWTSKQSNDTSKAWYRYLDYKSSKVFRNSVLKTYGLSVRCVKD